MNTLLIKKYGKWLVAAAIFFIFPVLLFGGYWFYEHKYTDKVYPGIMIGDYDFSGLKREEAKTKLNLIIDRIKQNGIPFRYHNQETVLYPLISSLGGDVAIEVIAFDAEATADMLCRYGREGDFTDRLRAQVSALLEPKQYNVFFGVNQSELQAFFEENFKHFTNPAQNARLAYSQDNTWSPFRFYVEKETYGQTLDYSQAEKRLKENISRLDNRRIDIKAGIDYPQIYQKDLVNIGEKAEDLLALAPLTLKYGQKTWTIDKKALADLLQIKSAPPALENSEYMVGLDLDKLKSYLKENVAPDVDQEPVNGKFEIKDGKVTEFQASRDGSVISVDRTAAEIEKSLLEGRAETEITMVDKKSEVTTENVNNLGIKELLGTGHSNFGGSPKNRRHNIGVGADSVNGTLVPPGEEFSLLAVIGEVNAETGYLPELVIKEGRTIPEYGGGLCQIGTTMFRATVESGLPVTARRNHSYRVSYYEPAGTDATIYDPWPDYKFLNDTGHHLLIQSRIEGDDLYFDVWGSSDGRKATHTEPTIYNIVRPAPTKIVETEDLAPGQRRCTEHAVNGADAYFDYSITYPDGEIDETRFKSHYVPWREVCLVGIDPEKNKASSTEEIL